MKMTAWKSSGSRAAAEALEMFDKTRFERQISLPEVGTAGQEKLSGSSVLVAGAGALGSAALFYLASAGVGRIGILDPDRVEVSNLQRQILYAERDLGRLKAEAASERLRALNSAVRCEIHPLFLEDSNADRLISGYDAVIDATDNFPAKFLASDTARRLGKPCSFGGLEGWTGLSMTLLPAEGPCLHCLFRNDPPAPERTGPFGALPGVIGSIQAAEILKILLGLRPGLCGILLRFDALAMSFRRIPVSVCKDCPHHPRAGV